MMLWQPLQFSAAVIDGVLSPGAVVVDATCGNGHDTLRLARNIGANGVLFGFDNQAAAITRTRKRLTSAGVSCTYHLWQCGHELMAARIPQKFHGEISAITFNLGYLPGYDRAVSTTASSTNSAVGQAARLLRPGGRISIVLYPGHDTGRIEAEAVRAFVRRLSQKLFRVSEYRMLNQINSPAFTILIEKTVKAHDSEK